MQLIQSIKNVFCRTKKNSMEDLAKIDRKRTEQALAEKAIKLPAGLTREEKRKFILSSK